MTARRKSRETANDYQDEICRDKGYRVIVCRDGIQWILQRLTHARGRAAGMRWRAERYFRTRAALALLWQARTGCVPAEILALPPRIVKRKEAKLSEAADAM